MTVTTETAEGMKAGASAGELAVMRQAAARLGSRPGGSAGLAGDDLFSGLSGPFLPPAPDGFSSYQHTGGHHFCTPGVLRAS
jgi:hypothetical protein